MNIHDLISLYIDGELSSEAEAELHHRLSVSPEDRKLFREQMRLRGAATDPRVLDRPDAALRSALFARLQSEEEFRGVIPSNTAYAARAPLDAPPVPLSTARAAAPRRRRRLVPILLPFVIAIIGAGLILQETGDNPMNSRYEPRSIGTVSQPKSTSSGEAAGRTADAAASSEVPAAQPMAGSASRDLTQTPSAAMDAAGGGARELEAETSDERATIARPVEPLADRGGFARTPEARRVPSVSLTATSTDRSASIALANVDGGEQATEAAPVSDNADAENAAKAMLERPTAPISTLAAAPTPMAPPSAPRGLASGGAGQESAPERSVAVAVSRGSASDQPDSVSIELPVVKQSPRAPAYLAPPEGSSLAFVSNVQQNVMIGMRDRDVRSETAVRVGGALADRRHEFFATLGYASYTQSVISETVTSRFDTVRGGEPLVATSQSEVETRQERRPEMWAGLGYRFNAINGRTWVVGGTGWAAVGNRNVRIGAELPVSYRIGSSVRIEVVPSARYVAPRGSAVQSTRSLAPAKNGASTSTEEVTSTGIELGVGAGVTVVIE